MLFFHNTAKNPIIPQIKFLYRHTLGLYMYMERTKTKMVACCFSHLPSKEAKDKMQFTPPILPAIYL